MSARGINTRDQGEDARVIRVFHCKAPRQGSTVIANLQVPGGNPHRPQEPLHREKRRIQLALRQRRRQVAEAAGGWETPGVVSRSCALRLFVWRNTKLGHPPKPDSPLRQRKGTSLRLDLCDSVWKLHRAVLEVLSASPWQLHPPLRFYPT